MYYPPPYYPARQPMDFKTVIIITVFIIVLLVGVYIYIKQEAKKALKDQLPSQYASDQYTKDEGIKIRSYATQIQDDLKGINIYHNKDLYNALLAEPDKIFTGVCIDYKLLTGTSIRKDINDEPSFSFTAPQKQIKERLLARFNQLNIF